MSKITISKWKEHLKDGSGDKDSNFFAENLEVKKHLGLTEMVSFVNDSAKSCFSEHTGKFMPEVKDFVIKANTIGYYTNLTMPENLEERYKMVYASWGEISNVVFERIDYEQYKDIINAVEARIGMIMNEDRDSARHIVFEIVKKISDITNSLNGLFDGVNNEDIRALISAISESGAGIDEGKLVRAIVDRN